jgi:hypothetical protein
MKPCTGAGLFKGDSAQEDPDVDYPRTNSFERIAIFRFPLVSF